MNTSQAKEGVEWRLIVEEMQGARRKSRFGNSKDGLMRRVEDYGVRRGASMERITIEMATEHLWKIFLISA